MELLPLDTNTILSYGIPITAATAISLTIARSFVSWSYRYLTFAKDTKRIEKAQKKGKVVTINDLPGPVGYPFLGILPLIFPYIEKKRFDLFFADLLDTYNGIYKVYFGSNGTMIISDDAAVAKKVSNSEAFVRNENFQKIAKDIAPFALFIIPTSDLWKKHRKGLQPAFGPIHIREAFKVSLQVTDNLLSVWESDMRKGNNTRNVMDDFTMLTGDIIARVAFSLDLGAVKSLESQTPNGFHHHMEQVTNVIQTRFGLMDQEYLWYFNNAAKSQLAPSMQYINQILKTAITNRRNSSSTPKEQQSDDKWSRDLLDRLLEPQGSFTFSDDEIMSEMFGFFLAGHETTANTLTWAVLEMTRNKDSLEKLEREVEDVVGDGEFTFEKLSALKYTEAFIKETLRLHPVLPFAGREAARDVDVTTTDGTTIKFPKGVNVMIGVAAVHRSKQHWGENAEEFYPDRWLIQNGDKVDDYVPVPGSYLPFWDGPHNCIGQKMAIVEAKVMIARMAQRYNLKLSEKQGPVVPVLTLTFGLKNGLLVDVAKKS